MTTILCARPVSVSVPTGTEEILGEQADVPGVSRYLTMYEFDSKADLDGFMNSGAFADAVKDFEAKWQHSEFIRNWGASYKLMKSLQR